MSNECKTFSPISRLYIPTVLWNTLGAIQKLRLQVDVGRWSKNIHYLSTFIPQIMSTQGGQVVKKKPNLVNVVCERPLTGMAEAGGQGGRTPTQILAKQRRITSCPLRFSDLAPSLQVIFKVYQISSWIFTINSRMPRTFFFLCFTLFVNSTQQILMTLLQVTSQETIETLSHLHHHFSEI